MRTDAILVNELQLGDALNQAVLQDRRGEFGLLLSMLVQDVRFQSQFQLQRDELGEPIDARRALELPEPAPLEQEYREAQVSVAEAFQQGGLVQSRLQHCLVPEPVSSRGEHGHGLTEALSNAEPWSDRPAAVAQQMRQLPPQVDLADLIAQQRLQSEALHRAA
ncbi:VC2046/SO_2500 family protein [Ferrimonas marina]|uniref:Ribosomal S4P n=1 Tax=Ferrimonas marina TaxID=299255 RepID=A0A1M5MD58_9GAMM|nr:VC2046/SO_2500 family protein [Ferrimonas marina]SHG75324.1 Ribosomal S4P [Ferrimonas marina]